jgi:hypothetical protein
MERQQQRAEKHKTEVKSPKKTPPEPSTSKKSSAPKDAIKPVKVENVKQAVSKPQKFGFKLPSIGVRRTSRPSDSKSIFLIPLTPTHL